MYVTLATIVGDRDRTVDPDLVGIDDCQRAAKVATPEPQRCDSASSPDTPEGLYCQSCGVGASSVSNVCDSCGGPHIKPRPDESVDASQDETHAEGRKESVK